MEVIQCVLWGVIPEEVISDDLVQLVEGNFRTAKAFRIKAVQENEEPARVTSAVLGFYPPYGVVYLSNPAKSGNWVSFGLSGINFDDKRIIFNPNESAFYEQRDAIVFAPGFDTYVRRDYADVLKEFQQHGFRFYQFSPRAAGDRIVRCRSPGEIPFGEEISIEKLV